MKRFLPLFALLGLAGCGTDPVAPDPVLAGSAPKINQASLTFTTDVIKAVAVKPGVTETGNPAHYVPGSTAAPSDTPSFTIASSEYPSWAALGTAGRRGLIDPAKGKMGPVERKWGVDIVLVFKDYDACITGFGTKTYDAICVTNIDILSPSTGRAAVAYCPTSTSDGGDAVLGLGYKEPSNPNDKAKSVADFLKGKKTRGLDLSVSKYVFSRGLEELGLNADDFTFSNMDPAQAAQGMQQGQDGFDSIIVWNPFIRSSLKSFNPQKPAPGLVFTSHIIPGEVIDMMVMGADVYEKTAGKAFAAATVDAYYSVCRLLDDPKLREDILVDLGKNFSNLDAKEMALCLQDTHFYASADEGLKVFENPKLKGIMDRVTGFAKRNKMLDGKDPLVLIKTSK